MPSNLQDNLTKTLRREHLPFRRPLSVVELARRHHDRATQDAPILKDAEPLDVAGNCEPKHRGQAHASLDQAEFKQLQESLAAIDCIAQPAVHGGVVEVALRCAKVPTITLGRRQ